MKRHFSAGLTVALAMVAGCKQSPPPAAAVAPPDAGAVNAIAPLTNLTAEQVAQARLLSRDSCLMCHSGEMLDQQRLTAAQWAGTVKKMQGWGAPLEADDAPLLAGFLAAHSGLDAGSYAPVEISPAQALAALAPQADGAFAGGDPARGRTVYAASCASCHGPDARGALTGINLVDRPILYRAQEFAEVVRKGRNRMPQANAVVVDADIAAVIAFLRALPGA